MHRRALQILLTLAVLVSAMLLPHSTANAASGYQWSSCGAFEGRLYWNDGGYLYQMAFRPDVNVKEVQLTSINSLDYTWYSAESFGGFGASGSYYYVPVRSGEPWGWHTHWSGQRVLYQSHLTVYADDGNWDPDCTIQFDASYYHFA